MSDEMDVVYVCRDGENPELRYSLRTLRNVNHDKVWVFGGAPSWLNPDTVNHVYRPQRGTSYSSTRNHILAACNTPGVSDPFLLWNDDFFAMEAVGDVPIMHRGSLESMVERFALVKTGWVKRLKTTAAFLSKVEGVEDPVSYDLHVPLVVYKDQMKEALRLTEKIQNAAIHIRTIYGNIDPLGGVEIEDPKMLRRSDPFPQGPWLSSSDDSFRSAVEPVLRYLFPDPSPHELCEREA